MTVSVRNLDWLRKLNIDGEPAAGARLLEIVHDLMKGTNTLEQQTNSNLNGNPTPPPQPQSLTVVPHPQGVQFSIQHEGDFYQGVKYEIDATANGVTHTYDVGSSRNGVLPVGSLAASYQVRARYLSGTSTPPTVARGTVTGGTGSTALLSSRGAGTTREGQPPGFGGPYRGNIPPTRTP